MNVVQTAHAIALTPALAGLLPRPIDAICREMRARCSDADARVLAAALDELVELCGDDESLRPHHEAALAVLREVSPRASFPSDLLDEMELAAEPSEDDAPMIRLGSDQDDRDYRRWAAICDRAQAYAQRQWRSAMMRMLSVMLRAGGGV